MIDEDQASVSFHKQILFDEIARLRGAIDERSELVAELFEHVDEGVVVLSPDGSLRQNPAALRMLGPSAGEQPDWKVTWGFFDLETGSRIDVEALPGLRALRERTRVSLDFLAVTPERPQGVPMTAIATPLDDGGTITIIRDIAARRTAQADIERQNQLLSERDAEHRLLIERLRVALDELSTPVLQVADGVLVVPIIGVLDRERSDQVSEKLLEAVVRLRARVVILDVTGVEFMDTSNADRFARLAQGVELLGARCLLSGVQPSVAQSLVALGVSLGSLTPQRNLAAALLASQRGLAPRRALRPGHGQ
jgi:rsbT co-antagonist protein RsbR